MTTTPCANCGDTEDMHHGTGPRSCDGTYLDGYVVEEMPCVCHGYTAPKTVEVAR